MIINSGFLDFGLFHIWDEMLDSARWTDGATDNDKDSDKHIDRWDRDEVEADSDRKADRQTEYHMRIAHGRQHHISFDEGIR